jgi:RimJ/RimL family protein N-acetyltransferase
MTTECHPGRLAFSRFDERFLERSWQWLQDAEIKRLTMTPDFTRDQQRQWFNRLPEMKDYRIWGLLCEGAPIGAVGLKHITGEDAEYWGYIGERDYWGAGLGAEMMRFIFGQAQALGLRELYLTVHKDNVRAAGLYTKAGFRTVDECSGVVKMRTLVANANVR